MLTTVVFAADSLTLYCRCSELQHGSLSLIEKMTSFNNMAVFCPATLLLSIPSEKVQSFPAVTNPLFAVNFPIVSGAVLSQRQSLHRVVVCVIEHQFPFVSSVIAEKTKIILVFENKL
jgi:hypothetical protein